MLCHILISVGIVFLGRHKPPETEIQLRRATIRSSIANRTQSWSNCWVNGPNWNTGTPYRSLHLLIWLIARSAPLRTANWEHSLAVPRTIAIRTVNNIIELISTLGFGTALHEKDKIEIKSPLKLFSLHRESPSIVHWQPWKGGSQRFLTKRKCKSPSVLGFGYLSRANLVRNLSRVRVARSLLSLDMQIPFSFHPLSPFLSNSYPSVPLSISTRFEDSRALHSEKCNFETKQSQNVKKELIKVSITYRDTSSLSD